MNPRPADYDRGCSHERKTWRPPMGFWHAERCAYHVATLAGEFTKDGGGPRDSNPLRSALQADASTTISPVNIGKIARALRVKLVDIFRGVRALTLARGLKIDAGKLLTDLSEVSCVLRLENPKV